MKFKLRTLCFAAAVGITGPAAAGEFGLAITTMNYGPYSDPADCPQGMTPSSRQIFLESLTAPEREEWLARDKRIGPNATYLTQTLQETRTPTGESICFAPTSVKDPPMFTGQSKNGYGLDLDQGDTAAHCAHAEFKGSDGAGGLDNQTARLTACMPGYQKNQDTFNRGVNFNIQSGTAVLLLHVTNVDDPENDPDVTVNFYRSDDRLVKDGAGAALPDATVSADGDAVRFHSTAHGRIVNGELITDPADVNIPLIGSAESLVADLVRGARFRLKIDADGYAKGLLAGYHDLESYYNLFARQNPASRMSNYSCPALYKAMHDLADGYKDPKTGQCTALSTALNITAVRSFVIPPESPAKVARRD